MDIHVTYSPPGDGDILEMALEFNDLDGRFLSASGVMLSRCSGSPGADTALHVEYDASELPESICKSIEDLVRLFAQRARIQNGFDTQLELVKEQEG